MASNDLISQCVLINGLPNSYRENDVKGTVFRHLYEGQAVINTEFELGIPGTPSRWLIQINSKHAAQKLCSEVKHEQVYLKNGEHVLITYERPQPSEIPKNWKYVQEMMYPHSSQNVTGTHDPAMFPSNSNYPNPSNPSRAGMLPSQGQQLYPVINASYGLGNPSEPPLQRYSSTPSNQFPQVMTSQGQAYHDHHYPHAAQYFGQANPGIRFSTPMSSSDKVNTDSRIPSHTIYENRSMFESKDQKTPTAPMQHYPGNQGSRFTTVPSFQGQTSRGYPFPATPQLCQPATPQISGYPATSQSQLATPEMPGHLATPETPGHLATPQMPGHHATPQIPGYPATSQMQDYPATPQMKGYPAQSHISGHFATPQIQRYPAPSQIPGYPVQSQMSGYPAQSHIPGYPAQSHIPGYPAPSQMPGYPAIPHMTGYPATPQIPGQPATQQSPGHIATPPIQGYPAPSQIPGYPAQPQMSGYPARPQMTGYPAALQIPRHSATPHIMGHLATPQIPGCPATPQLSGHSAAQQIQGHPPTQQIPNHPETAQIPGYSETAQTPGYSETAQISGHSETAQIPGYSEIAQTGDLSGTSQTQTSIRVDGVKDIHAKDTIEMYFESRHSGGGDIECVWFDCLDDDVMFIQFKEASVAKSVLGRSHTFQEKKLNVSACAPISYYADKVLIVGLKQTTTKDCLSDFLEVKADCLVTDVYFSRTENTCKALVTMDQSIDMQKLEKACLKYKLEGASLTVSPVPVSNCLLVTSLTPDIYEETIQLYFENSHRSGGGTVDKVKLNEEKTACLVYFKDFRDIDNVIKRKQHIVNNVRLTIEHFQPCLGLPECFTRKKKLEIPSNFILEKVNSHVISLLRNSKTVHNDLEARLRECNALPSIESSDGDKITISYICEDPSQEGDELVKNWEQNVSEICTNFIDGIVVNETKVTNDGWENVKQSLNEISIENPNVVLVKLDNNAKKIIVTGYRDIAGSLIKQIETIKERKHKTLSVPTSKDRVTVLKPIENKMLDLVGFRQEMNKINSDLKVSFEDNYAGITFEGTDGDISKAKLKMYEARNSFGVMTDKVSDPLLLQLYKSKQTDEYISNVLQNHELICLFEVKSDTIMVYSGDQTYKDKCVHIIRKAVARHSVEVNKDAKGYLETRLCKQKIKEIQQANEGTLLIEVNDDDCYIEIYAIENILEDIVDEIEEDISKNASLQKKVNCSVNEAAFIEKHKKASLVEIEQKLQEYRVKIVRKQNGFIIQGPVEGTKRAIEQVQKLIYSIKKGNHTFKETHFALSITSKMGRERLDTIEKDLSCLIAIKGSSDDKPENPHSSSSKGQKLNMKAICRIHDKLEIQIVQCDITEVDVSMIVNSTDEKISMSHGLGKILANKGGREVRNACIDFIAQSGKLRESEPFVSPAGDLNADYILHLSVPKRQQGHETNDKLFTAILNCLHKAEYHRVDSIAIPAIGCGAARYPVGTATDIIVAAIERFFSSKQTRTVTKIILCDMKSDNVDEFTKALTNHFGKYKVKVMKQDEFRSDSSDRKQGTKHKEYNRRRRGSENVDKVLLGNITVAVVRGSVAKQRCDAIVNIVDKTVDLKRGTISACLLHNGGDELQQELKTKCPNGLEYGQMVVTSGKKLTCQFVIHSRLGPWNGTNEDSSKESLQTFLNTCLRGTDQQKVSTVVIPAVGTGKLGYPKEVAAKEMFTTIAQYSNDNKQSTIKEIRIVIYQEDMPTIEAFENESSFWETGERHNPSDLRSVYLDADNERRSANEEVGRGGRRYQLGMLSVTVKVGNILDEDSDSIVTSIMPKSMDLEKGAVSKEMYKRCGDDVKAELEKKKDWFRKSEIVTTSAPNLNCKGLIHVATQDKTDGWENVVGKSLKKAEDKQWKSVAFPALGTSYRIKPEAIAECMVAAFIGFERTKPRYVSDIRLVIYQRDMFHVFHDAVSSAMGGSQGGPEPHRHLLKDSADPDCITFTIFATENRVIERAVSKIDECYDKRDFHEAIIKTFTKYYKDRLKDLESIENVAITFDKDKGSIQICGLKENVSKASEKVHSILRESLTFEKNKESADMTSVMVQWFYTDTGSSQLVPYDKPTNFKIEKAFRANDSTVSFKDSQQEKFTIDLKQMVGHPVKKPSDVTTVVRKDLVKAGSANIPSTWATMTGNLSVVALAATDPEYIATKNTFIASIGNANVVKIERVQNKALWQQYQAKKQQMDQTNPPGTKNETLLWHGSSSAGIENIKVHGFDRSYSNMGCSIGVGVYFSPNAAISRGYAGQDAYGNKRMFHCRVLTGEYTQGQHSIRYPPPKPSGGPHAKYDSDVNNMAGPTEFVIFNDTQAYPEYLISFQ